jgi:predicted phage tail component-like protein
MAIKFNNQSLPDNVQVQNITNSILPPIERNTVKIAGKAGTTTLSRDIGDRVITVSFVIDAPTAEDYHKAVRDLATFLYYDEPKKLEILSEPSKYYMAMVDGESEIEPVTDKIGTVEITLIASQPFAYDDTTQTPVTLAIDGSTTVVENKGNFDAYPVLEIDFKDKTTYVGVANNTTGEQLVLGAAVLIGEQNPYDLRETLIDDSMAAVGSNTQLSTGTAFNPIAYASINPSGDADGIDKVNMTAIARPIAGSTQTGLGVEGQNYGTGSGWHGAGLLRSLTDLFTTDDFSMEFDLQFENYNPLAVGKMEMYIFSGSFLGADAKLIAKLNFQDSADGLLDPQLWVKFCKPDNSTGYLGYTGSTTISVDEMKNRPKRFYHNPTGLIRIRIARRNTNWRVWIALIDPSDGGFGKVLKQDLFEYNDVNNELNYDIPTGIVLTTAVYNTHLVPTNMIFHGMKVYEELIDLVDETGRPYIFDAGDKLVISTGEAMIYKNGELFFEYLDPTSNFIKLVRGNNDIVVQAATDSIQTAKLVKNERYL